MNVGYRTESAYGEGYVDAVSVLAHEIGELGNVDILDTLQPTLAQTDVGQRIVDSLWEDDDLDALLGDDPEEFVTNELLPAIKQATGVDVKYVLWLCADPADVMEYYNAAPDDIDAYPVGDVVLSDLGREGILWGYTSRPEPIKDGDGE